MRKAYSDEYNVNLTSINSQCFPNINEPEDINKYDNKIHFIVSTFEPLTSLYVRPCVANAQRPSALKPGSQESALQSSQVKVNDALIWTSYLAIF